MRAVNKGMLFSTFKVVIITLVIKLLGLIKQGVLAACCGASAETDAFFIATGTMVNVSTIVFSAISISLLTFHTKVLTKKGRDAANRLISSALKVFVPLSVALAAIFFFGSSIVAKVLAPTYQDENLSVLSRYIKAMVPAFILWCYFLTVNVVLETDKKFVYGKGQGLFQNIFLIVGALVLYPRYGMSVLVYAFLLSGLSECVMVTIASRKQFKFVFGRTSSSYEIKRLIEMFLPLLLGNAIYEINSIVDGQVATSLQAGSASVLNYGATINDMVVGVLISSVSTVLFSNFSTWLSKGEIAKIERNLQKSLEYLTLLLFPIMIMCIFSGDQIVEVLYGRGNFGEQEILHTYGVVIGYAVGFAFQAARANLVKVYYAFQDSRQPMFNGVIAVLLNVTLSILLSRIIGVAGVALATSISMLLVTCLLLKDIRRYLPGFTLQHSGKEIGKGLMSASASSVLLIIIKGFLQIHVLAALAFESVFVIVIYVCGLLLLKSDAVSKGKETLIRLLENVFSAKG